MRTINIHQAKTHLSRLVDQAAAGEPFIIAKAGRALVRVVPLDTPEPGHRRRLGFLEGQLEVPEDFDDLGADRIRDDFDDAS
jgi:prevent-host-death family protein